MNVMLFAVFFLTPLTALGTAAAAASIPIIIHLLNRKRFRVVPWAAMRFLLAAQKRTVRRLRIEQWVLLAIRTLLILLLILAMVSVLPWTEPLWNRLFPGGVGRATAKTGRTHRIIAIDGSFSMGRRHDDGTSFERATALAKRLVQEAAPGDGFSLLLLGSPVQTVVAGPSDNSANVISEIQQLRLPHGNSDLAGGLSVLDKMASQPLGKYHQREVYLLTDLQRTFFQGGGLKGLGATKADASIAETWPPESDAWQRLQTRASVILIDVAREGADNLAVTNLYLGEPLAMANSLNTVTATVHNFGTGDRDQLKVELLIGKARSGEDESKAEAEPEAFSLKIYQQLLVNVPAGAGVPVTFPLEFTTPGDYVVQVRIESDALDLDNARSLAVRVHESVPVLLINGKPAAERDEQATHHLEIALNPTPGTRGSLSPFRPKAITEAQFADELLGDLSPYDCVFLCDVARLSERKIARLDAFLRKGGGVVFCLGGQVDFEAYNRLLYKDGEGLLPAKLVRRWRSSEGQAFTLTADDESFKQPPLAAFGDEGDRATLLAARFREYIQVVPKSGVKTWLSFLPPNASKPPPGSAGSVALDPAILEWQRHRGRVILITTTANIDWNSWAGSPAYLPFVHELTRHAALGAPPRVVNAGEPLVEYLPAKFGAGFDANLALPDGRTATVPVQEQDGIPVVHFPETDQSGIYRMTIGASRREYLFAVNVPASTSSALASESDLRRIEADELRAASPDGDVQIVTDPSEVKHRSRFTMDSDDAETGPRSSAGPGVARALLFLFLALVILETILAWRFGSARTVAPPEVIVAKPKPSIWRIFDARNVAYFPLLLVALAVSVLLHEAFTDEFLGFLPGGWRLALEQTLGVPAAAPGEGTRWKLDYLPYLTGRNGADRWLAFGLIAGAGALAVAVYRAERIAARVRVPGENTPASRPFWPLAGMRFGLLLLTLLVFLPQLRLFFEREGWPDVVILIDTSKSMGKPDDYEDSKVKDRADQLGTVWKDLATPRIHAAQQRIRELQAEKSSASAERQPAIDRELAGQNELLEELQSPNRLNLIKALVAGKDNDWLTALLSKRQLKVHVYQCSNKAVRLAEVIDAKGAETAVNTVRDLRPLGESSQLGGAVRAVLNDFRGGSLGAIVMLTDGVTTEGDDLLQAGRHAARADVPLFFVGMGDAQEPRDLILHDLQAEDSVNVRDRLVFDVRVSVKGNLAAKAVPVVLSEKDKDGNFKELKSEIATLDPNKPTKVRLTTTPTEPGDKIYVLTVPVQKDETDTTNNRVEKAVHVADAKTVKLLYVEGRPRYEYRFLKTLLEREQASKKGNRSVELKTLLVDADRNFPAQDKTALAEFPGRTELYAFDAVILGDVDPKNPKIGEQNLLLLRDFVRERGGGLLFLAGEDFMPQAYRDTPLADVLPVVVAPAGDSPAINERAILEAGLANGYRPTLTSIGQQHPIFRFATEDAQNAAIWNQLPPLMWAASGYRLKPASEVLAVHPQLPARRGGESSESDLHPLVVQQFVGAGRTMFFGFDETWRWRFREFEPRYNQFWLQSVRYLARSRLGRVEIRLDKQTPYRRNEPVRVTVRFPDDQPAPAEGTPIKVLVERARLRRPSQPGTPETVETQTLLPAKVKGTRASYEALLTRTPEGEYKFWLAAPTVEGGRPVVEGRVLPPPGEMDRLRMNKAEMEQAAKESRGRFYTLADADGLVDELPAGTRVSLNQPRPPWLLWNHAAMFALALGLLTSEWVLRKRRRLL